MANKVKKMMQQYIVKVSVLTQSVPCDRVYSILTQQMHLCV